MEPFCAGFSSHSTNIYPWSGPFLPPSWLPYIPHQTCQEILLAPPSNTSWGLPLSSAHLPLATTSSCIFQCVSVNPKLPIYPSPLHSPWVFCTLFTAYYKVDYRKQRKRTALRGFLLGSPRAPETASHILNAQAFRYPELQKNRIKSAQQRNGFIIQELLGNQGAPAKIWDEWWRWMVWM